MYKKKPFNCREKYDCNRKNQGKYALYTSKKCFDLLSFALWIKFVSVVGWWKNFYLPRVCGENLQICPFKKGDKLVTSSFNICEPCSNFINPRNLDLVVVPALMADKFGFRLGYGGGFYDRFLVENNTVKTILPIAKELIVEELPHEEFDIKIDEIIPV